MTKLINFEKRKLESLKPGTKPTWYYAKNFEGLALVVGKKKKTYYAHWSVPTIQKDGIIKREGKRKWLGGFHIPLDEIKEKLRKNLDEWKKAGGVAAAASSAIS